MHSIARENFWYELWQATFKYRAVPCRPTHHHQLAVAVRLSSQTIRKPTERIYQAIIVEVMSARVLFFDWLKHKICINIFQWLLNW